MIFDTFWISNNRIRKVFFILDLIHKIIQPVLLLLGLKAAPNLKENLL